MKLPNRKILENLQKNKYFELLPDLKEERAQKFTTLVLTLVALIFFGIFAIQPTLSTIAKLKKELKDSQYVDQQLSQKIENLTILEQKYASLQDTMPVILSTFPTESQVPLLIAQLQSLGKKTDIVFSGIQVSQTQIAKPNDKQDKYSTFSFTFTGEGTYENILNYLTLSMRMQRIISIEILSISKRSEGDLLQFNFKGTGFFKK